MTDALAAVLFDMDGLLVETESLWLIAEQRTMAAHGGSWSEADQHANLGGPLPKVAGYMNDQLGGGHSIDELGARLVSEMIELLSTEPVHWQPGARELVHAVRAEGIPRALVSASYRVMIDAIMVGMTRDLGADAFDVTIGGDETPRTKPFPDPYLIAAERLGVDIRSCVVLEDSETGSRAGMAAGALVVGVPSLIELTELPGRRIVRSLEHVDVSTLSALSSEWLAREL